MTEPPASTVYDSVPLPLGESMCIRVIKIRPSTVPDYSDTILCDFSILDVDSGKLVRDSGTPKPEDYHTYIKEIEASDDDDATGDPAQYHLCVSDRVQYQALSYTWGEPPAVQAIELDGTPFKVRKNLWQFLDRARRKGVSSYLWIDVICINQILVREKNHQVSMMGDIYTQAECVLVWLGNCTKKLTPDIDRLFNTVAELVLRLPRVGISGTSALQVIFAAYLIGVVYGLCRNIASQGG